VFRRTSDRQKALDADVFIEIRPMDSFSASDQSPVAALCRRSMR
jgi:hypothetical protein